MKEEKLLKVILETIPQWFESNKDPKHKLHANNSTITFCSSRRLTPNLNSLLEYCQNNIEKWLSETPDTLTPSAILKIKQEIALYWLSLENPDVNWGKLLSYAEELSYRTYENSPVTFNLVISNGAGTHDITDTSIQKYLDPLATSLYTYLKVDHKLHFIDYCQINWSETTDTDDYKFNPEFLQPYKSILDSNGYSFHLTTKGDMVFMDTSGLLAACRKGGWYIYDVATFKNSIVDIISNNYYRVGCNLFEVLFDLSYKRHGALLIFDPDHNVLDHVVNKGSIIDNGNPDFFRSILAPNITPIAMGNKDYTERKKRLFLEIAGMDGAVIFDERNVLAFGAMIESHKQVGEYAGARTTAFASAHLWGGKPFKISSDGDISIRFGSNTHPAIIQFM